MTKTKNGTKLDEMLSQLGFAPDGDYPVPSDPADAGIASVESFIREHLDPVEEAHQLVIMEAKTLGQDWLAHCEWVAKSAEGVQGCDKHTQIIIQTVAWLHDVVEDTPVTLKNIEAGWGPEIAAHVDALTRRPGEQYLLEYIPRVAEDPVATFIKLIDLEHHLTFSKTAPSESYLDRCRSARHYLRMSMAKTQV